MGTVSSGDTLSLVNLGDATATGGSEPGYTSSFSACANTTTGPISMKDFTIDSVDGISGYSYNVEDTNEVYGLSFSGEGSRFGRIKTDRALGKTSWRVVSGDLSLGASAGHERAFYFPELNPQAPAAQTTLQTVASHTIGATFNDSFNDHIGSENGYNVELTKVVYTVDSYDGNSTALCLTLDTPITLPNGETILAGDVEDGMKLKGVSVNGISNKTPESYLEYSSDSLDGSVSEVEVVDVIFSFTDKIYNFNDGLIKCTSEHPFMIIDPNGTYKFKRAHLIEEGDSFIQLIDGEYVNTLISSIELIQEDVEIVSIDVDGSNIYLANNIITHNKEGNSHTDFDGPTAPTTVSYSHPSLSWSGGTADTDSVGGITAYDVQVDNNSNFSSPVINETNWNATSIQLAGGDIPAGTYYARIRNVQSGLKSGWTTVGGNNSSFSVTT